MIDQDINYLFSNSSFKKNIIRLENEENNEAKMEQFRKFLDINTLKIREEDEEFMNNILNVVKT